MHRPRNRPTSQPSRRAPHFRQEGHTLSHPVVHFEVIGKDPGRLRSYFGELFGWRFDTPSPVASEVSDPAGYGFLDLIATAEGTGIRGGVGGGPAFEPHALF